MVESLTMNGTNNDINTHYQQTNHHNYQTNITHVNSINQTANNNNNANQNYRRLNEFERLIYDLNVTNNTSKDVYLRRIGFYNIGNELGSGNFSQVKLGIHLLTKGRLFITNIYTF